MLSSLTESAPSSDATAGPRAGTIPACLMRGGRMGELMRSLDWTGTRLGAPETWPQSLRTSISICLDCHFPILVWWGPELVMLYNDDYRPMLGGKHPASLGQRGQECWSEIWHIIGPMLRRRPVRRRGDALRGPAAVAGKQRISGRTLFQLFLQPDPGRNRRRGRRLHAGQGDHRKSYRGTAAAHRARSRRPRAGGARFRPRPAGGRPIRWPRTRSTCRSPCSTRFPPKPIGRVWWPAAGIAAGRSASPEEIMLRQDNGGDTWPLGEVVRTGAAVGVEDLDTRFRDLPSGGWTVPPAASRLIPIVLPAQNEPAAVLVAGLNPHKRLDRDYQAFLDLLAGQIGDAIADARAYEEERRRADALAETRPRENGVFFECQPRVPHAADAAARADRGQPRRPLPARRPSRAPRNRSSKQPQAAQAGEHAARLLARGSRADPGDLRAHRSGVVDPRVWPASSARHANRQGCPWSSRRPNWRRRSMSTGRCGRRSFSTCCRTPSSSPSRARSGFPSGSEGEYAVLRVADTGTGIPEAELPRLFERFHRIEGARGRTHEGTGIGLALVQELVGLHKGSIEVASTLGRGSIFTVRIPLGSSHLPPDRIAPPAPRSVSPGSAPGRADSFVGEALRWLPDAADDLDAADGPLPPPVPNAAPDSGGGR